MKKVDGEGVSMTNTKAKDAKAKDVKKDTKKLSIEQVASGIGGNDSQVRSLRALGLGKIGRKVVLEDNPCVRGLVRKILHLVKIGDSNG
jgi:large subunit ribosomal protein L30